MEENLTEVIPASPRVMVPGLAPPSPPTAHLLFPGYVHGLVPWSDALEQGTTEVMGSIGLKNK